MQKIPLRLTPAAFLFSLITLAFPGAIRAQTDAAKTFSVNCTLCHGADGSGNTPTGKALKAKDLRSAEVQKESDEVLAAIITKGQGKMPAFGKKVSPELIKSLVAHIRKLPK